MTLVLIQQCPHRHYSFDPPFEVEKKKLILIELQFQWTLREKDSRI